jgi:hypothetical protein
MKILQRGLLTTVACLLAASAAQSFAIEGLKIAVRCPDVILSWPSATNETYIVQYRPDLSTNSTWATLTNSLPAATDTNVTFFVHSNMVTCSSGGGGGGGGGGSPPPLNGAMSLISGGIDAPVSVDASPLPVWVIQKRPPHPWELENRPPFPWEAGASLPAPVQRSSALGVSAFSQGADNPQPLDDSGGGGSGGDPGFYRVVRVGIHLFGMTNGTVLSGQAPLAVEFGNTDTNGTLAAIFLSNNGSDDDIPGSIFPTFPANSVNGTWDTAQVTNGIYTIQLGAMLDDETVYMDSPVMVTVSNSIWFPDPYNVGGQAIYIGAQTSYTNGTWHLDIYDDQNTYVGYLNGPIDTNGYCAYPGIPGPGFSLDNTDGYGNQNPSTFYTLVMAVQPSGRPPPYPVLTNKIFIEPSWNFQPTYSVICYMNMFESYKEGYNEVVAQMQDIWGAENLSHPCLLGDAEHPFEVFSTNSWNTVLANLTNTICRDFVYFGHGGPSAVGTANPPTLLTVAAVNAALKNNSLDPLTATNMHPYRFVFLDGCSTANGNFPQAFGIPKQKGMVINDFTQKRGIRPRAFVGWSHDKAFSYTAGMLDPDFQRWRTKFWDYWSHGGAGDRSLQEAIHQAALAGPSAAGGIVVYGAQDLTMNH